MLKKVFIAIGVVGTCLIGSCTLFLGLNAANDATNNKAIFPSTSDSELFGRMRALRTEGSAPRVLGALT